MKSGQRGPVIQRRVPLTTTILVQQEPSGSWVAVRPAYHLQEEWATGSSQQQAITHLMERLRNR
jgi:hypothetical protein